MSHPKQYLPTNATLAGVREYALRQSEPGWVQIQGMEDQRLALVTGTAETVEDALENCRDWIADEANRLR